MDENVISMREVQRNYKKIFDSVKKTKKPIFLGPRLKPSIVVLDIDSFKFFKNMVKIKKNINWKQFYGDINKVAGKGRKNISLSDFIINDRENR